MRQWRTVLVAGLLIEIEAKRRTGSEFDPTFAEGAEAQLRSLQVGNDADWSSCCSLNGSNRSKTVPVFVVRPVAEI